MVKETLYPEKRQFELGLTRMMFGTGDHRGSRMRIKISLLGCVLLVLCVDAADAQAAVSSSPAEAQRRQLSLQQQSNILSDIQQHQHRFNLRQNPFNTAFSLNLQQLQNQPWINQQVQFPGQNVQQFQKQPLLHTQLLQQQIQGQNPSFQQNTLTNPVLQNPLLSSPNIPIFQTPNNPNIPIVQHHTQTSFTPNFNQPLSNFPSAQLQARPTSEPIFTRPTTTVDPEKEKERLKQLKEKQAIIDKHNQFVEKQYEKSLKKAQEDHVEWVEKQKEKKAKLYQKLYKLPRNQETSYSHAIPRYIYPEEAHLFELAVKKYYEEHPTTTTTTTTTTTEAPDDSEEDDEEDKIDRSSTKKTAFLPTSLPPPNKIQSLEDLNTLKKQYKEKQIGKDDLLAQLRLAIANEADNDLSKNISSREISLGGKKVQVISTTDPKLFANSKTEEITLPNGQTVEVIRTSDPNMIPGNNPLKPDEITLPSGQKVQVIRTTDSNLIPQDSIKSQEITLPNGQKVEIIRTTDPKLVPGGTPLEPGSDLEKLVLSRTTTTTTIKPPKEFFDEIAKDVIPKGSNFQLLKTGASGGLEHIESPSNLPDKKKVTFVLLEEQADGTLKVQGVKGTGKDKPEVDVDSILKKIRNGEIKLPNASPKTVSSTTVAPTSTQRVSSTTQSTFGAKLVTEESSTPKVSILPNSFATSEDESSSVKTKSGTDFVPSSTASSTYFTDDFSRFSSSLATESPTTARPSRQPHILNHGSTSPPNDLVREESSSSAQNSQNSIFSNSFSTSRGSTFLPRTTTPSYPSEIIPSISQTVSPSPDLPSRKYSKEPAPELVDILKKQGLFAMAKFLKQSGLDTILNETGPYTIFVPNDKAFRTLLVQLGGPERAEQKFKDNPRLLSGLLLHHVIPGAFTIGSLQDEMTGVSLAGTQLRVNQYNMHDAEWNDIKLTTINGAKVLDDKKDIEIPQGMAHAVDRVMFPLPVGDIVQTLQSDRERRFTNFLRALFAAGLADSLQGSKTFTLFAPTDKAFVGLSSEDLSRMITDKKLARELVLRHLIPGTLYTNGMRYFQIKDSLQQDRQITINKQSGKLKINNNYLTTQNIPATNGVIHAIDTLL